ncbi:MAG: helix-turn-helix domain-containing protein [Candidatus Moduliflexus flocculans]|nr:helix-turn-helix domain-containing protein [Candidatus Moduliflexus flocculans]
MLLDHFLERAAESLGRKSRRRRMSSSSCWRLPFPRQRPRAGIHGLQRGQPPRRGQAFDGCLQVRDIQNAAGPGRRRRRARIGCGGRASWPSRTRCRRSSRSKQLLVDEALRRSGGNQAIAAMMLGITRQALNKRVNKAEE